MSVPQIIIKRNGAKASFDVGKIYTTITKALAAVGKHDVNITKNIASEVASSITEEVPSVEHIQDVVEQILIKHGHTDTAKAFILYRDERTKIRTAKLDVLGTEMLDDVSQKLPLNSVRVLASRYLMRDKDSKIIETPTDMFKRVSATVVLAEILYDDAVFDLEGKQPIHESETITDDIMAATDLCIGDCKLNQWHIRSLRAQHERLNKFGQMKIQFGRVCEMLRTGQFEKYVDNFNRYYDLMTSGTFLPNSPTLMNAGCRLGQLSACFVLDMDDSLDSIMDATKAAAIIFQSGGGVGINWSNLRQLGAIVASTSGVASGPVSFMNIINTVTDVVKQGGKRRGANMGILDSSHPDIETFIKAKGTPDVLENFNVSVGTNEQFWHDVRNGKPHILKTPSGEDTGSIDANQLLDSIAMAAWGSAEPGLIFFDHANKHNVLEKAVGGPLRATNPCGEQLLYPNESCNLGSINVGRFVDDNGSFDWDEYIDTIHECTAFLDGIVDANVYPTEGTQKAAMETRRTGLGVMGVADCLAKMSIRYDSEEGYAMMAKLCEYLTFYSMERGLDLARERGAFKLCKLTDYADGKFPISGPYDMTQACDWDALSEKIKETGIRNVLTTTIAPTGTIAMIAGCSNGVEPFYSMAYIKKVSVGTFEYTNDILAGKLNAAGLNLKKIMAEAVENGGSIQTLSGVPQQIKDSCRTAMDIHWADHVIAQAVCQDWIGNAISKTINMPGSARIQDVKAAYVLAHGVGTKGITVYRDGSRATQVLTGGNGSVTEPTVACLRLAKERLLPGDMHFVSHLFGTTDKTCECGGTMECSGGCHTCRNCGLSLCSSA